MRTQAALSKCCAYFHTLCVSLLLTGHAGHSLELAAHRWGLAPVPATCISAVVVIFVFGSSYFPGMLCFDQCGRKKGDCCSSVVHTGHQRVTFLYNGNFSDSRRLGPLSAKVHTHNQCGPDAGLLETFLLIILEPSCSYFLSYKC